jgi:hypothetical protein
MIINMHKIVKYRIFPKSSATHFLAFQKNALAVGLSAQQMTMCITPFAVEWCRLSVIMVSINNIRDRELG